MKKITLLATSVALALTGCNSSSDGETPPPPATDFTITAIDGYLQNAFVFGTDSDISAVSCNVHIGNTDDNGQFAVPAEYKAEEVCIQARAYTTIDSNRGVVTEAFELRAPSKSSVINPMTNMVSTLADSNDVSEEEAKEMVVETITAELNVDPALIFGDYIADQTDEAEALNIIGEILVDHADLTAEKQLELAKEVAEQAQEVIEDGNNNINDFNPVVEIDDNGGITVSPNQRPQVVDQLEPLSLEVGNGLKSIYLNAYFNDPDGDALTYSMEEVFGNTDESIDLDEELGIISGSVSTAGNFIYHIFATDDKGARSYPLVLSISVETEILPPAVDDAELRAIQSDIDAWSLKEGSGIEYKVDVTGLFNSDQELRFEAESSLEWDIALEPTNLRVSVEDNSVAFHGAIPRSADAGVETLTIHAFDNVNSEPTVVEFKLPKIELDLPEVDVNPDEAEFLQSEISSWVIYEGEEIAHTLNATYLFESDDVFVITADSSLAQDNSGFHAFAREDGTIAFSGNVPRSAPAGQETLTVFAVDESREVLLNKAEFKLPEIHEGITPPPGGDHPLEGTWYALEWGSNAGDGNEYGISRVWCDTIRLEDGKYYFNQRQASNIQECSPTADVQIGTYTINGDIVELEFDFIEDDEHITGYAEVSVRTDLSNLYTGALEVQMAFEDEGYDEFEIELFTWFDDSSEPKRRINLLSDADGHHRQYNVMMPGENELEYNPARVSMSLQEKGFNSFVFDVYFDVYNHDFTCQDLGEFYDYFQFSGIDASGMQFTVHGDYVKCYTVDDEDLKYVNLEFDVNRELAVDQAYSFIGFTSQMEYTQDLMFNMVWTGEGNND
ncbi:hypothetical protein ACPV51_14245 [Vibrio astriarenae]